MFREGDAMAFRKIVLVAAVILLVVGATVACWGIKATGDHIVAVSAMVEKAAPSVVAVEIEPGYILRQAFKDMYVANGIRFYTAVALIGLSAVCGLTGVVLKKQLRI
jgi:hypothetical protein